MTGDPRTARVALSLAVALALLAGCTASRPTPVRRDPAVPPLRLVAFDTCADLLSGLRAAARESVGPDGLPTGHTLEYAVPADAKAAAGAGPGNSAVDSVQALPATPGYSGTNTHEAGVDEPDLVKTDGRRIVTVSGGTLRVVNAASRQVTGSLALDQEGLGANLLLAGDHALVLTRGAAQPGAAIDARPGILPGEPNPSAPGIASRLLLVDLAGAPRVLGRYSIDGSLIDARQVGAVARVVVRSSPRLPFHLDGDRPDEQRLADNRKVIDAAPVERWLPSYTVDSGGRQSTGRVDCQAVSRPSTYSGASLLTVLTFDLAGPTLGAGDPISLVADGDTVYGNGPSLYVATDERWRARPMLRDGQAIRPKEESKLYKFDVSGVGRPRYVAGGAVPGWLISQYAMSEWDGKLRVATTLRQTESSVYVLDGSLRQVGHVGGLGKGERIYAVRFVGPTGYVVTFRQTDPLYVVDLRDSAQPRVTGELKINGYSAYLHPAGDGRLIGVGQDADSGGRRKGMQVSLFDVADPARPTRVAQYSIPGGNTEAEFDPHAFLYWPATRLLVVPVVTPGDAVRGADLAGALALRLSADSIAPVGKVTGSGGEQIRRSLVIGDVLWTVSDTSLSAHDASSLTRLADLPLAP
jgi:uncharacterized secreted protein with C-terminal beta-propeller domain